MFKEPTFDPQTKKETQDVSSLASKKPTLQDIFDEMEKPFDTTDEEAENMFDSLCNLYQNTPINVQKSHQLLEKLEHYMFERVLLLTQDNDGELIPQSTYYALNPEEAPRDALAEELEEQPHEAIFNRLREIKPDFENYSVQQHIEDILNLHFAHHYVDDVLPEDSPDAFFPTIPNKYASPDNEYMQWHLQEDFGLHIQQYSSGIRKNFFEFFKNINVKMLPTLRTFIQRFGDDGLKTFLVLEIDGQIGNSILKIGELIDKDFKDRKFPPSLNDVYREEFEAIFSNNDHKYLKAKKIFRKIAELVDLAEMESEKMNLLYGIKPKNRPDVRKKLLESSLGIIQAFATQLEKTPYALQYEPKMQEKVDQLLTDLEQSKTEIILLSAIFRTFKEQGNAISFEDIRDLKLSSVESATELSEEEKKEMLLMAETNWQQNLQLKDTVLAGLKADLESDKPQKIYILRYQGKIASFIRFEATDHGTMYAGSFNVKTELRGVDVGNEMIERTLIKESREKNNEKYPILEGTVSPRIPVGTAYVEKVGFVIDGLIANYHETHEPLFTLQLDNNRNPEYAWRNEGKAAEKKTTAEQLQAQYQKYADISALIGQKQLVLRYDLATDFDQMMADMQQLLLLKDDQMQSLPNQFTENKYRITRYFIDKSQSGQDVRYFALEKNEH